MSWALAIQGLSAAYGASAAQAGASSRKESARLSAVAAKQNAAYTRLQATHEILVGQQQEMAIYSRGAQVKSAQIAAITSSGIELSSGTAQDQLTTTDVMKMIDVNTTRMNTSRQAWATNVRAEQFDAEAEGQEWLSSSIDPNQAMWSSLLGSAAHMAPLASKEYSDWSSKPNRGTLGTTDSTGSDWTKNMFVGRSMPSAGSN